MNTVTVERNIKDYLHLYLGCNINTSLNGTKLTGWWYDKIMNDECDALPILRPLSDMTEEEGSEWAALKDKCWDNYNLPMQGLGELTLWLLSKHFDLFNLIPDGLAVSTTKQ